MKKKDKKANKKTICIALILLILIMISAIAISRKLAKPNIELIGESEIVLNLEEEYKEQGAIAKISGKELEVKIEGDVDTSTPGEYNIQYIAQNNANGKIQTITRKVIVHDNVSPEITLNGEEKITLFEGREYEEKGATASDNIDGDISEKIETKGEVDVNTPGKYEIEYVVADNSGNNASIKRIITVKEKPKTVLKNGLPVLMYHFFYDKNEGSGRDDNWMEISDFEDQIKYLVEDEFYFPTWEEVEQYIDGDITLPEKSVVITVDDGDDSFFELAVPVIQKYNVRATSFLISEWYGWRANEKEKNIYYESHTESMHEGAGGKGVMLSWPYDKVLADLKESRDCLGGATIFCYPFGHYDDRAEKAVKEAGYKLAFTTVEGRVYKGNDKYALPRVRTIRGMSLNTFKKMVN